MTRRRLAALAGLLVLLAGCSPAAAVGSDPAPPRAASAGGTPSADPPGVARVAEPAPSQRVRFVPERVVLPGGASAAVEPAETVNDVLQVPTDIGKIGWWTGSAYVGDPFGATVLAGHVDSVEQGMGFFARLLRIKRGDRVRVSTAEGHQATYQVSSVRLVAKGALSDDDAAFDQTGDARLVLLTCAGAFIPAKGGYQSNLVVIATPLGLAR